MESRRVPEPDRAAPVIPPADTPSGRTPTPAAPTGAPRPRLDPAALPLPYMSRRRLAQAAALLVVAWLVIAFGRQIVAAANASTQADALRGQNAALRAQVSALQADVSRVQDGGYVEVAGRAYGLGGRGEIPFTLEAGAPTPGPTAPGSASVRLGAERTDSSPLDGWVSLLFGSGH